MTVVGGQATVGRLSNNVFWDFSSDLGEFWKKTLNGHATVVEVTRPSADCQTTFFGRFKQLEIFFEKSRWTVTWQWSEVRRLSAGCQTTFFGRFKRFGRILKKIAERSRDSGRRSRDRRPTVKQRFLDVSSDLGEFWKKSLNGHATVVGGHATVGRLSNNVFWTFQAIRNFFEKSRWTVTWQWSEVRRLSADCQTTVFGLFKRFRRILKKVAERSRDSGWGHATVGRLSKNFFWTFQAIRNFFEKSRWTVTWKWSEIRRLSAGCQTTFFGRFKRFGRILKKVAERSRDSGWGHATVGRLSNNFFWTFQAIRNFFEKSRWTVTWQWSEVTRLSADCQTTIFGRFKQLEIFLKKVAERSRDSGRRSRDRRPTVKQRFLTFQAIWENFEKSRWTVTRQWSEVTRPSADCQTTFFGRFKRFGKILKKSLNGHATVVEVTRPSADCQTTFFWTFQAIRNFFEKSRWTVTWQWSEVTRLSADCQTTFFWTFLAIWENFEKSCWTVTRQWLRSRDRRPTVKQRFWTFQAIWENFEKSRWTVTWQWSEVTRPSADCQTTFFGRFKRFGEILKKIAERSRESGWGHATVGRLSNNDFLTFQAIGNFFEESRWTVTRQWSEVTRPSADCQATFFGRFKRFGKILKKVAERSRDSGWGHATVGRLSNNVFWTFQAIWENFEKSRWTVTRQWSEVTRPSADCQTTFFGRFKRFGKILKEIAERSRDSGWGHATVGRLSNNVFWTFQAIKIFFEKSRWTVTRQWLRSRDRRPVVKQLFWTFQAIKIFFEKSRWTVTWQWSEVRRPSADCQTTFFGRFKRFGRILKSRWTVTRQWLRSRDCRPTVKQRFWTFQAIWENFEKSRWTVTQPWLRSRDRRPTVKQRFFDVSSN